MVLLSRYAGCYYALMPDPRLTLFAMTLMLMLLLPLRHAAYDISPLTRQYAAAGFRHAAMLLP